MKHVKIILALLFALGGIVTTRAQTDDSAGANTIITVQRGTNIVRTVIPGTNTVIIIQQGTNIVGTVVPGTNAQPIFRPTLPPLPAATPTPTPVVMVASHTNHVSKADTNRWASTLTAGLTLTRGNSDLLLFTAKITTQKKDPKNEYLLEADAAYGENDHINNADSLHGAEQYNHLFTDTFYGFANLDALHDGIQGIEYRFSINPGAGYYFIKDKTTSLVGELGPGVVTEKLEDVDSTYASMRVAEHLDQKLSPTSKCWEKVELISQINEPDNYYVNFEAGMETAITKKMSLQVTFDDDYVHQPAAGRVPNDIKLVSGITYKF